MNDNDIKPLGPAGVQRRMAEIQSKIDQILGSPSDPTFSSVLEGKISQKSAGLNTPMNPFGMGTNVSADRTALRDMALKAANRNNVDPALFDAVVQTESDYNPSSLSNKGAIGLCQLEPKTAASLGVNPFDSAQNLEGGARFLKSLLDHYGDIKLALAAYNAGSGAVHKAHGIPQNNETPAYVKKVLSRMKTNSIAGLEAGNLP